MNIKEYDTKYTEIWLTEWNFYNLDGSLFIVPQVICKRIPLRFVINEQMCYNRATKDISVTTAKTLQKDKTTGLLRFKINYIKFISNTN